MKTLKIYFADFWPEWNTEDFITPILSKYYNLIIDRNNPDVVFHSIFGNSASLIKCPLKILYIGENIRYLYNDTIRKNIESAIHTTNYSISYDPHTNNNYRLPLWQVFLMKRKNPLEDLENKRRFDLHEFKYWCSFIVSNSSNFIRNSAFQVLHNYKYVNSYGKIFNNDKRLQNFNGNNWREKKEEFLLNNPHKFAITFENSLYKYYCTEKLMDAFLVGSIPIYWGDPKVNEDWNSKAFINVTNKNVLEEVKRIDNNKELFIDMYNESVFTKDQLNKHKENINDFEFWLCNLIEK